MYLFIYITSIQRADLMTTDVHHAHYDAHENGQFELLNERRSYGRDATQV